MLNYDLAILIFCPSFTLLAPASISKSPEETPLNISITSPCVLPVVTTTCFAKPIFPFIFSIT